MRLSEAIRLGSMDTPRASGYFVTQDGGTCAQGAALHAVGRLHRVRPGMSMAELNEGALGNHRAIREEWPWTLVTRESCPVCGRSEPVGHLIPHLNNDPEILWTALGGLRSVIKVDAHGWSREQIADWLAFVEQKNGLVPVESDPEPEPVPAPDPVPEPVAQLVRLVTA